ncbi:MAG: sulfite reductase subunit alpha [Verrucomicrobiota bacterium]
MEKAEPPKFSRKNPLVAKLKEAVILTGEGSGKDTRHYEISLEGSGLVYEPGDSLALFPTNCPEVVEDLLGALKLDGDTVVSSPAGEEKDLRSVLRDDCAITQPDKKFLKTICEKDPTAASKISPLLEADKKKELADYLWGREIVDFLTEFPGIRFEAAEFVGILKKLAVRLYSIASSLKAHEDEVHLTVATVIYESFGRKRKGVCSTFLADRVDQETGLRCFISPGKGFRLPAPEEDTPIIMIGPGTGIAPFRAFVEERKATGAKGKAWLFFGEQHKASDFFYEDEWADYLEDGTLSRMDTAFSRDQDHKIYVQHRLLENGADIWAWLEDGAIVYVCGDASRMANDVDKALHEIIETHGGQGSDGAAAYVDAMKKDKRYRRDVY